MYKIQIYLLLLITFLLSFNAFAYIPETERKALIDLYMNTSGPGWNKDNLWLGSTGTECDWYGVTCNSTETNVIEVRLINNNLKGNLPVSLSNLSKLQRLSLGYNFIGSEIPESLGQLSELLYLSLDNNQLVGSIPDELANIYGLNSLILDNNQLTGYIPEGFGNLQNLRKLILCNNMLIGNIPASFKNLENITLLHLNNNDLSGDFPLWINSMRGLKELLLHENQINGTLPMLIGYMPYLENLSIHNNKISGKLPDSIGAFEKIKYLNIRSNLFSGKIPDSLLNLTDLLENSSDFRYNALYSNNDTLKNFLNTKQIDSNWQSTQTLTPTNIYVSDKTKTSITLKWTIDSYIANGGYELYYTDNIKKDFNFYKITTDKTINSMTIYNLNPSVVYYIKIRNKTLSHINNSNDVYSEYSSIITQRTNPISIYGYVYDNSNKGIEGVTIFSSNYKWTITDYNGYYALEDLAAGMYDIEFNKYNYLTITKESIEVFEEKSTILNITLPLTLSGKVTDALTGKPLCDVIVSSDDNKSTLTDDEGNYFLNGISPKTYSISFSKYGYQSIHKLNVVISDNKQTVLNVSLPTSLYGYVTDLSSNNPIPDVTVMASNAMVAKTDELGFYSLGALTPGKYDIDVTKQGYQSVYLEDIEIISNESSRKDIRLTAPGPLNILTYNATNAVIFNDYFFKIIITGGRAPYDFSIINGTLASGLKFDKENGTIYGQPIETGEYYFSVGVTDDVGSYAEMEYNIKISSRLLFETDANILSGISQSNYNFEFKAYGGTPPYTFTFVEGNLPDGVELNSNGVLSGYIENIGSYDFKVRVTDSALIKTEKAFHLSIIDEFIIKNEKLNYAYVGEYYNCDIYASGDNSTYKWSLVSGNLPEGLYLDNEEGLIAGRPFKKESNIITISVTDIGGRTAYKDFEFYVSETLDLKTYVLSQGLLNSNYNEYLKVKGGFPPFIFTYEGIFPKGITLDESSGIISGIPSQVGVYNVDITVSDSSYPEIKTSKKSYSIRITRELTILTNSLLPDTQKYKEIPALFFHADGGKKPYKWLLKSGKMPDGLFLDSDLGFIYGVALNSGEFEFEIQVVDSEQKTCLKYFYFNIYENIKILTESFPELCINDPFNKKISFNGGFPPYQWEITEGILPDGLYFNQNTGVLYGIPQKTEFSDFTIRLSYGDLSEFDEINYNIKVHNEELFIGTSKIEDSYINNYYYAEINAKNGISPFNWNITNGSLPDGLNINYNERLAIIEGTPYSSGTYSFTLQLSDSSIPIQSASKDFVITIYKDFVILTEKLSYGEAGQLYSQSIELAGGKPDYTCYLLKGILPQDLIINPDLRHLTGTIQLNEVGDFEFYIRAVDSSYPKKIIDKKYILKVKSSLENTLKGDLNGNNIIQLDDAIIMLQILSDIYNGSVIPEASINENNKLTILDLIYILQNLK